MTNKITRRAFLKCAGAVTVAAGAASVLSGCDQLVGTITGAGQGDQESIYARVEMGDADQYVLVGLLNYVDMHTVKQDDGSEKMMSLAVRIGIKNYRNESLVFSASDVTNAMVDDHILILKTQTSETYNAGLKNVFVDSDSVTYAPDLDPKKAAPEGYLVFEPKDGPLSGNNWSEIKFDLKLNGKKASFRLYHSGNKLVSSAELIEDTQPPK